MKLNPPKICTQFTKYLYLAISLVILVIVAATNPAGFVLTSKPFLLSNPVLLAAAVLAAGILFALGYTLDTRRPRRKALPLDKLVFWLTFAGIPLQFYLTCNYYFHTGWDVGVLSGAADAFLSGDTGSAVFYLSTYPNNVLLFFVMLLCKQLDTLFGVISPSNGLLPFILLNCILSSVTGWLTYQNIRHFCSRRWAILGFVFYWGLIGVSPWVGIPYSDSLTLAFPSLIFFLYTRHFTPPHSQMESYRVPLWDCVQDKASKLFDSYCDYCHHLFSQKILAYA